jgi:hypothetical protein
MVDHATPPAEFNQFRESALLFDASEPTLESHFRSLPAHVNSLLNPTRSEDRPGSITAPAEGHPTGYSPDELALLQWRAAALEVGLPSGACKDEAIDSALRTVAEVLLEIQAPESQITALDAAVRTGPMPPRAVRELWPAACARSGVAYPSNRPTQPNSTDQHTKRDLALVVAGLAVLAFGVGVLFNQQINGLLHAIEEFLRHQSVGAGQPLEIAKLCPAASLLIRRNFVSFSILTQAAVSASRRATAPANQQYLAEAFPVTHFWSQPKQNPTRPAALVSTGRQRAQHRIQRPDREFAWDGARRPIAVHPNQPRLDTARIVASPLAEIHRSY